jgi:hypothetical protein
MDWQQIITSLGVGGAAIYVLWDLSKRHIKQLDERDRTYKVYVESNNHKMTELVVESTKAISKASEQIGESTKILKSISEFFKNKK